MSRVNVSVILPAVSDKSKFTRFCTSLFASELNIELLICEADETELIPLIEEEWCDKISFINKNNAVASEIEAFCAARGQFMMLSDVSVIFAPKAFEKMIVASRGGAAAANVAIIKGGESAKAFSENFYTDELGNKAVYFNHLLLTDKVKDNISFCESDSLSQMLFIAYYYRYDTVTPVNEVLFYTDSEPQYDYSQALPYLPQYADAFKVTANDKASTFFLRAVFSAVLPNLTVEAFEILKAVTATFADDYLTLSWLKNTFGVDSFALADESTVFADFKYNGTGVFYKEVSLPVAPDSVVKNFYFGKFGIDTLKKCIGAWGYYKFYRRKDDFIKKLGCKIFKRLLGGDFDV